MLVLALDACALVHAKALSSPLPDVPGALGLLDGVARAGARFITTKRVYIESVTMSLQATLSQWEAQGALRCVPTPSRAVRAMERAVSHRVPRPGRADIALVYAAREAGAFLLTHDNGCGAFGRAAGLGTVDLLDLGYYAERLGLANRSQLDALFAPFSGKAPFRPSDWSGSMTATELSRPGLPALLEALAGA